MSFHRLDIADYPLPRGVSEVWRGRYDSDRRVEILAEELEATVPGVQHFVTYLADSRDVLGTFYVPIGHSLEEWKNSIDCHGLEDPVVLPIKVE